MPLRPSVPEKQIRAKPKLSPAMGSDRMRYSHIPPFSAALSSRLALKTETLFQLALRKICQPPAGTARAKNEFNKPFEVTKILTRWLARPSERVFHAQNFTEIRIFHELHCNFRAETLISKE